MHSERSGFLGKVSMMLGIVISIIYLMRLLGFNVGDASVEPMEPFEFLPSIEMNGADENIVPMPAGDQPEYQPNPGVAPQKEPACSALSLASPQAEATVVNPVHFEWSGDAGVYYQVYVKDAEPEPDYVYQSNWLTANTLDLSIPDEGIGNLEWHVTCKAAPDAGTGNQSTVGHFVYDPFYLQKTRQAGDGTQ